MGAWHHNGVNVDTGDLLGRCCALDDERGADARCIVIKEAAVLCAVVEKKTKWSS